MIYTSLYNYIINLNISLKYSFRYFSFVVFVFFIPNGSEILSRATFATPTAKATFHVIIVHLNILVAKGPDVFRTRSAKRT